jgi:NADH dehydrogenase (ubiquinone) Fe-S protein 1
VDRLGDSAAAIGELASGKHAFAARLKAAKKPMLLVGAQLLMRPDAQQLLRQLHALADDCGAVQPGWNGFCVLHEAGGRVAALDLGFGAQPPPAAPPQVVLLLGADEFSSADVPDSAKVIYIGSHGDAGAARADVVLPGAAYTEKPGTYVNTEGRPQRANAAVTPPGSARDDWKVLRALSEVAGVTLPYDTLAGVRARLAAVAPSFSQPEEVQASLWLNGGAFAHVPEVKAKRGAKEAAPPLTSAVANYYMTDVISRASAVMARCTAAKAAGAKQ